MTHQDLQNAARRDLHGAAGRDLQEMVRREVGDMTGFEARLRQTASPLTVEERPTAPRAAPRPIPVPVPEMIGHRVLIYKQDPSVQELGVRAVFIPTVVLNGPRDARIQTELAGVTPVARNINGDFIFTPNSPQFDCAHTFAVVRETLSMYERHNGGNPIPWAWNVEGDTEPVTVHPHAGEGANAFYTRTAKALKFLFFTPQGLPAPVFTCRSLDIVAHETAHAILDGLKPGWLAAGGVPQTGGLHEAFGDLTACFLTLSQPDQAEALIALTKANLHDKSFLNELAEEFGRALGLQFGLRNADNDLKLSEVGNEVHAISQVFTGGVYDVLADIYVFERDRQRRTKHPTIVLIEVANALCKLLFDAIVAAPPVNATFTDVVNKMLQISAAKGDPPIYRTFIRNRFALREVVVSPTPLDDLMSGQIDMADAGYTAGGQDVTEVRPHDERSASLRAVQDRTRCCGTLQMPEYRLVDSERLARHGALEEEDILARDLDELRRATVK
jgi:hypothetical protein